ncbi:MAG: T9SS type A sorting domain-containing protein, partial [candidate division WOR-3 bacterium]
IGNNLRLRVKSERGVDVKIYTPNGVKVFDEGFVKSGVYNIPLRRGVYFLKAGGKTEKIVIL